MADGKVSLRIGEELVLCRVWDDYVCIRYCDETADGDVYVPKGLIDRLRKAEAEFDAVQDEISQYEKY